jgi:excisionase family DNA binding protein
VAEELLTVREVADYLKVNQQTVRNWVDRQQIDAVRVGERRVRIRQSELDRFLSEGTQDSTADAAASQVDASSEAFGSAMRSATERLDAPPPELALALVSLADAANALAQALDERARPQRRTRSRSRLGRQESES